MPRGGRRPGAGRKPKPRDGSQLAARVLAHPASAFTVPTTNESSPIEEFDAPNDLTADERVIWLKQAPHAFRHRTLTRASAMAFERYCKLVVMERDEAKSSGKGGPKHIGMLKELNRLELQFLLTPNGRPMPHFAVPDVVPMGPQSALAKFR